MKNPVILHPASVQIVLFSARHHSAKCMMLRSLCTRWGVEVDCCTIRKLCWTKGLSVPVKPLRVPSLMPFGTCGFSAAIDRFCVDIAKLKATIAASMAAFKWFFISSPICKQVFPKSSPSLPYQENLAT